MRAPHRALVVSYDQLDRLRHLLARWLNAFDDSEVDPATPGWVRRRLLRAEKKRAEATPVDRFPNWRRIDPETQSTAGVCGWASRAKTLRWWNGEQKVAEGVPWEFWEKRGANPARKQAPAESGGVIPPCLWPALPRKQIPNPE